MRVSPGVAAALAGAGLVSLVTFACRSAPPSDRSDPPPGPLPPPPVVTASLGTGTRSPFATGGSAIGDDRDHDELPATI